ncbi:MAG TPA: single-stranded DNA-binding protein [Marmoricola sp.]
MNDTQVTLTGWIGTTVSLREAGGVPVAGFRMATTPRRYDRKLEQWVDGDTQWYSVTAWRQLARNCAASLRTGDPVVLHGRLTTRPWTTEAGKEVVSLEVEATFVGHDLTMGLSRFARNPKFDAADEVEAPAVEDGTQPAAPSAPSDDVSVQQAPTGAGAAA